MINLRQRIIGFAQTWSESSYQLLNLGWRLFTDSVTILLLLLAVFIFTTISVADSVNYILDILEVSYSQPFLHALLILSVILRQVGKRLIGTRLHERNTILDATTAFAFTIIGTVGIYFLIGLLADFSPARPFMIKNADWSTRILRILITIPVTGLMMILAGIAINGITRGILLFPRGISLVQDIAHDIKEAYRWLVTLNNLARNWRQIQRYANYRGIDRVQAIEEVFSFGLETIEPIPKEIEKPNNEK